jgi:primary-amine oxidase
MGWSFYLSFARDMGMSLWDVRFRGERILYEISPQEALAVYCMLSASILVQLF